MGCELGQYRTYPEAAPPDLTPPVSPSAMRAAVYEMPRWEAGMMLRREDLAIVCSIGRYIFWSEILGVDLECVLLAPETSSVSSEF